MTEGLTFDAGALIGLEQRDLRIGRVYLNALRRGTRITVPAVVLAAWWRGRTDVRERILAAVTVEPMTRALAALAGEALAAVRGATVVDALVMASAAQRGDLVYTSDHRDLARLQRHFPTVRVLSV